MKKIVMTTVIVLLAGIPLAFAASSGNIEPDSRHCTYVGEKYDLCHQDRHKNGGERAMGVSHGRRG